MKILAAVFGCALLIGACTDTGTNSSPQTKGFAIYKLADSTIKASSVWGASLDTLELSQTPFLTQADLQSYSWSTHSFVANARVDSDFSHMRYQPGKSAGVPFVVVVDQSRIYVGGFWWNYSSAVPQGPFVVTYRPSPYQIDYHSGAPNPDRRSDPRIYDALRAGGVLRE
jgi:hypothetical protein